MIGAATARAAPDLIEAIIGYRSWHVAHGMLQSPMAAGSWMPGVNRAACGFYNYRSALYARHTAPGHTCGCGFYGFYSPEGLSSDNPYTPRSKTFDVFGAVKMWGTVELHSTGLRAEYAEPVALYAPEPSLDHPLLHRLSGAAALAALGYTCSRAGSGGTRHRLLAAAIGCTPAVTLTLILQYRKQQMRHVAEHYGIPLVDSLDELQACATAHGAIITDPSVIGE